MILDFESPRPMRPFKRALEDVDPGCAPANKRHRLLSPTPSPIYDWLSKVPPPSSRPSSAPTQVSGHETLAAVEEPIYQPKSLATIQQISQSQGQSLKRSSNGSSQSLRPGTSHPIYRSILLNNDIRMDLMGKRMPKEIRDMIDGQILKRRSSPPLPQERVLQTVEIGEDLAESAEGKVSSLMRTEMFPVNHPGIGEGGDTIWSIDALPYNTIYQQPLSAPKPDFHYGYAAGQRSGWTRQENAIADHAVARPYAQPARGNKFPFLALEIKSEATGGTLWHAGNQAAGSGTYCVNAMLWLLRQASPTQTRSITDSVAFTGAATHREILFHVHYYSEADQLFYMSYFQRFSTTDPADVQGCHDLVKNILDYGLTTRQEKIKTALALLFPLPDHWKQPRPDSTIPSTPATSYNEDPSPGKSTRKG
ncbi:MAG: hypothetical protein Q9217_001509 [Psora testacea]